MTYTHFNYATLSKKPNNPGNSVDTNIRTEVEIVSVNGCNEQVITHLPQVLYYLLLTKWDENVIEVPGDTLIKNSLEHRQLRPQEM